MARNNICLMNRYELKRKNKGYRRKWGSVKIIYKGDTNLCDIAEIIKKTVIEYAEFNARYCEYIPKRMSDFVMGWGELQNQGICFHSLYQAFDRKCQIITEFPLKLEKESSKGKRSKKSILNQRIDYLIYWKKKCVLIEYKHNCVRVNDKYSPKENKNVKSLYMGDLDKAGWNSDFEKFEKPEEHNFVDKYRDRLGIGDSPLIKVVLIIVPIYHGTKDREYNAYIDEADFNERLVGENGVIKNLGKNVEDSHSPNLWGYWWLPEERQKVPSKVEEGNEYYQGVYFIARIFK